jgi:hypothetical protein
MGVRRFISLEIIGPKSLGIVLWRRIYLGIDIDDVDVAYSIYREETQ